MTSNEVAGRGVDPAPGAGRLLAGSNELPELASSLALRLPTSWMDYHWEALDPPPGVVLRLGQHWLLLSSRCQCQPQLLEEGRGEFQHRYILNKGNSSHLSMMLGQGLLFAMVATSLVSETGNADKDCSPFSHSTYLSLALMEQEENDQSAVPKGSALAVAWRGHLLFCAPADQSALSLAKSTELVGMVR
jgi:hypothetical protein